MLFERKHDRTCSPRERTAMRLIKDHILRNVHGKPVLVPLSNQETDFNGMVVLNHSGEFVCKQLGQDIDRERLIVALAEEYDKMPEQVAADVDAFLAELDACHLLVR